MISHSIRCLQIQNLRSRFTDRLETALSQLGDSNTRYANLQSSYDLSREELRRTEAELKRSHEEISELERKIAKLQSDMETREVQVCVHSLVKWLHIVTHMVSLYLGLPK